jgi:hypothetical protein
MPDILDKDMDSIGGISSMDQEVQVESVQVHASKTSDDVTEKEMSRSVTESFIAESNEKTSFEQKDRPKETIVAALPSTSMVSEIVSDITIHAVVMSLALKDQQDKKISMSAVMNEILDGLVSDVVEKSSVRKEKLEKEIGISMIRQSDNYKRCDTSF